MVQLNEMPALTKSENTTAANNNEVEMKDQSRLDDEMHKEISANHAAFVFHELSKFQRQNLLCDVELASSTVDPVHAHKVVLMSARSFDDVPSTSSSTSSQHFQFDSDKLTPTDEVFSTVEQAYNTSSSDAEDTETDQTEKNTYNNELCCRLSTLNQLRLNGKCCDVMLISDVDGQEHACHRVVLAACSDYFRAMFTAQMRESEQPQIRVHGIGDELARIVEFMYTGEIDLEGCDVVHLLAISVYLHIQTLVNRCVSHLVANIADHDCCTLLWVGTELSISKLALPALDYISHNLHKLYSHEIELLTADHFLQCLKDVSYEGSQEFGVLKTSLRWCRANMNEHLRHNEVMQLVRYAIISKSDIEEESQTVDLENDSKAIVDWMEKAKAYHSETYKQPLMQEDGTNLRGDTNSYVVVDGVVSQNPVRVQTECSRISVANQEDKNADDILRDPFHSVVELGGFVYVLGGTRVKDNGFSNKVERYDPRVDEWVDVAPMLQARADFSACVLDGCIIVMGGRSNMRYLNTCEKYDPDTNTWSRIARLPQAMYMAAAVVCKGQIYMSGGFNEYEALDGMIRYNQERNKWERLPGLMMEGRGYHVMIESPADGRLWVIGGIDNPFSGRNTWKVEAWNVDVMRWQYVGEVLPVKMFTSTIRLNATINGRNNITVFPVTHAKNYGSVEYYSDRAMWLESKNPTPVFDIAVEVMDTDEVA